jgi:hypothetical protein
VEGKVKDLCEQMERLSVIATSSPQSAHSAFVHGVRHKWTYLQRILPNISSLFAPLESVIQNKFLPALLGGRLLNAEERVLFSLPGRKGGMSLENPTSSCDRKYKASLKITEALSKLILQQDLKQTVNDKDQRTVKISIKKEIDNQTNEHTAHVQETLSPDMRRAVLIAQEKGASSFITALPLKRYGFSLTKNEFRDAVFLRYMWPLPNLPSRCVCGSPFSVDHSQICHTGGFINMRHDAIRDLLATEMKEVLRDVQVEPPLTPLSGEVILPRSANREPDARADIRARGFWLDHQSAYFNIRVFYPHAHSYLTRSLSGLFTTFEREKKRQYADRILQIEHGSFTPLIFSSCGGVSHETNSALRKLASMVAERRREHYGQTIALLRMRLHITLLRASIICLRGSRSRPVPRSVTDQPADMVLHELRSDD